ncbi:MAG: DUF302 domain-containing protein [Nitrospirae bacterium]|nr:DUF302 domain-containing protein [Nitrospirota bacterium]
MLKQTSTLTKAMFALALAITLSFVVYPNPTEAAEAVVENTVVHVKVNGSVDDVVSRLKKLVADNDMMVMGELHQGRVLSMTGLSLQSETLFVGSPVVGKQLFSAEPGAGVVVPVRINIYADAQGNTVASYAKPSALLGTFGNPKVDKIAGMLDAKFQNIVQTLAK